MRYLLLVGLLSAATPASAQTFTVEDRTAPRFVVLDRTVPPAVKPACVCGDGCSCKPGECPGGCPVRAAEGMVPPEPGMRWVNLPGVGWGWATDEAVATAGRPASGTFLTPRKFATPLNLPAPKLQTVATPATTFAPQTFAPAPAVAQNCPGGRCPNPARVTAPTLTGR